MKLIFALLVLTSASQSFAESETLTGPVRVKVTRSAVGKEIIIHSPKVKLKPGRVYQISEVTDTSAADDALQESKKHLIGMAFDASLLAQKNSSVPGTEALKGVNVNLLYGWNWERVEAGPIVAYSFQTVGTLSTKTFYPGVYLDLNLTPNSLTTSNVFGLRLIGAYAVEDNSLYVAQGTGSRMQAGLVDKWFGLSTAFAVVTQVAYKVESLKWTDATITRNGVVGNIGLQTYF